MAFVKLYSDLLMWYIIKRIILHSQSVLDFGKASPKSLVKGTFCVYTKAGNLYCCLVKIRRATNCKFIKTVRFTVAYNVQIYAAFIQNLRKSTLYQLYLRTDYAW
jgi:hypothetical protein